MKINLRFPALPQPILFICMTLMVYNCTPSGSEEKKAENNYSSEKSIKKEKEDAQLYIKSFGDKGNTPIIFLHGGPGYNCANFEGTTAQALADNGFFVIAYDRRGEGRSIDKNAKFDFIQTFDDLNAIYKEFKLDDAILIGHSYGGVVATLFAQKNPEKIRSIVLVGAPVSLQETFKTIIRSSRKIYEEKKDETNLKYIAMLEKMDTASLEYGSYCFGHAMQNGFYSPKNPTKESIGLYKKLKEDASISQHAMNMTIEGPKGFFENENYTMINLSENITRLLQKGIKIYGMYGKEDGLYSSKQIESLKSLVGDNNLLYFENCSHNVFIDQQTEFINALKNWNK